MINALDKRCRENQITELMFDNFFSPENRAVYEIMSKNMVEPDGPQMTSQRRIRVACWISKATYTHAHAHAHALRYTRTRTHKYNIYRFSTATMVREGASMLRYSTLSVFFFLYEIWFAPPTDEKHALKECINRYEWTGV